MTRIERVTSPLPRECSTTEPHGRSVRVWRRFVRRADRRQTGNDFGSRNCYFAMPWKRPSLLERETGIEPVSLAWKAKVLPLNYSRGTTIVRRSSLSRRTHSNRFELSGGGGWIRTSVGVSQQIYSLPPLATRAPLRRAGDHSTAQPQGDGPPRWTASHAAGRYRRPRRRRSRRS